MILGSFPVFFFEKPGLSLGSFDCMFLENEHTHTDIYIYIYTYMYVGIDYGSPTTWLRFLT